MKQVIWRDDKAAVSQEQTGEVVANEMNQEVDGDARGDAHRKKRSVTFKASKVHRMHKN